MTADPPPPPRVKIEFVTVDGPEGEVLEERQLTAMMEVLAWLRQNSPAKKR